MSNAVVLRLVVVGAAAVIALAWRSIGRSRAARDDSLAAQKRTEAESKALRQHRPQGESAPLGPFSG